MTISISTHNLGKKYYLSHQNAINYGSLREDINRASSNLFKFIFRKNIRANKNIEEFWALKDFTIDIQQGERVGLVGRNGAGKSTLLKLLSRITQPSQGDFHINGNLTSLLEVGTGFHPELTGRENIYLNGAILGMSRRDIALKFDQIVSFSEVERFLDTPVKHYSSGMYLRLAFSVAAHLEPDILIIDEILAVGDIAFQKKCLSRVKEVGDEGRTVLIVSHNMETIQPLCDRGILLEKGKLVDDGEISSVISKYIQSYEGKQYSMTSYTSREGIGGAKITNIVVNNENGRVVYKWNAPIIVNITAELDKKLQNGQQIDIGVSIDSIDGKRLFTTVSSWVGCTIKPTGELLEYDCEISNLPFVSGRYLVSVSIITNNRMLDCIIHCGEFTIEDNNKDTLFTTRCNAHGELVLPSQFIDRQIK